MHPVDQVQLVPGPQQPDDRHRRPRARDIGVDHDRPRSHFRSWHCPTFLSSVLGEYPGRPGRNASTPHRDWARIEPESPGSRSFGVWSWWWGWARG
ncbi:hypothetical protein UO65_1443 [Actinokineospora spheciospongiae]|uniref:Uncharacterized protein n=1 Tax=Actinokineospora spheciospongiae TaxID=909613 RepID=W7JB08_9PSEU|nr:hypothetical protein UO65_1443 [Actinokineospora spheciospongiae]